LDAEVEFERDLARVEEADIPRRVSPVRRTPVSRSRSESKSFLHQNHSSISEPSVHIAASTPGLEDLVADDIIADGELSRELEIQKPFCSENFLSDASKAALSHISLPFRCFLNVQCGLEDTVFRTPYSFQFSQRFGGVKVCVC
jgi:hypothetical protein